jgi:tellurite resistance protein
MTTGLPLGVQQLVDQTMQQTQQNREQANESLVKFGSEFFMAALAVVAANNALAADQSARSEKSAATGGINLARPLSEMSTMEKAIYFEAVQQMSLQQWNDLGSDTREKVIADVRQDTSEKMVKAADDLSALNKEMDAALTPEQKLGVMGVTEGLNLDKENPFYERNLAIAKERLNGLPFESQQYGARQLAGTIELQSNAQSVGDTGDALDAEKKGDTATSRDKTQTAVRRADAATQAADAVHCLAPGEAMAAKAAAYDKSLNEVNTLMPEGGAAAPAPADRQAAHAAEDRNFAARATVDATLDAQEKRQLAAPSQEADYFNEPTQPVITAPAAMTINGGPLLAAGLDRLGAPETVANDAAAAGPRDERRPAPAGGTTPTG